MQQDVLAVCESRAPQHYEPVLLRSRRQKRSTGCSRERPLSALRWRGVQTLSAQAVDRGTREKNEHEASAEDFNRPSPLKRRISIIPADLDLELLRAIRPHKQKSKSDRSEGSKRVTTVIEHKSRIKARFRGPRPAKDVWEQCSPSIDTGRTLWPTPPKRRESRHAQFGDCILERMPVGYHKRRYPADVAVLAVLRERKLSPTFR